MEHYTDILPVEILEYIYIYSIGSVNHLDLYESKLFNRVKLTPYLVKRIYKNYNFEILDRNISLYVVNDPTIVFKFRIYSSEMLHKIIMTDFNRMLSATISYIDITNYNYEIFVDIVQIPNIELLYDYISIDNDIFSKYMNSISNVPLSINFKSFVMFNGPIYYIRIGKKNSNFSFNVYLMETLQDELIINKPHEFVKKLIIYLGYYRINYRIKII